MITKAAGKTKTLDLSGNKIATIEAGTFDAFRRMTKLILNNNRLKSISGVFSDDESFDLEELHLEGNKISTLEEDTFSMLESLKSLYLDDNPIETIDEGAFDGLHDLQLLSLDGGELNSLPWSLFKDMS